ncbi:MAG: hypothetical protein Fur0010_13670 [Bdellovibrio sp.]
MSDADKFILDFYRDVAKKFGLSGQSTMKDPTIRMAEEDFFCAEINRFIEERGHYPIIADVGCGNGHLLSVLRQRFPKCDLIGIEFTPELLELALERNISNAVILHGDIRNLENLPTKVDIVITERVLINLLNDFDKSHAFSSIKQALKPQGRLLMSESFIETWKNMNAARKEMRLEPIAQSKQNRYMTYDNLKELTDIGFAELKSEFSAHHLSTHFYITRIFHHLVRPEGGKLEQTEFVKFFNHALGPGIGEYSPIQFRVFEKMF